MVYLRVPSIQKKQGVKLGKREMSDFLMFVIVVLGQSEMRE